MNRKESQRLMYQEKALLSLGFTQSEAASLRRISMTLHRWHEKGCGLEHGCIERDETTGKPFWLNSMTGKRSPVADLETGALKRLQAILNQHIGSGFDSYVQTDPRGAALYILRPGDVPAGGEADSYYSRGIVVY